MMDQNFHLWWTRNSDKNLDLILIAMNAHDYMMDKNCWQEIGFDPYSNECSWNYMMDNNFWQEFGFDLHSNECSWNYMMDKHFWQAFGFDLYSSECLWNYRTSSFTMTCYDLAKEDQLDAEMMILIFELSMSRKIVCQSLNRNLWYHLILLKLEKWCFLISSEMEPMPNPRAC